MFGLIYLTVISDSAVLIELQSLLEKGYELVSGGTENHLVLVNLRNKVNGVILSSDNFLVILLSQRILDSTKLFVHVSKLVQNNLSMLGLNLHLVLIMENRLLVWAN